MRAFAERVLPDGWALHVPEAMHAVDGLEDGSRGRTWWRMDRENLSRTPKGRLTPLELDDMDRSALQLEDELPSGPLVVGGFSQGGIMAKQLLHLDAGQRVAGVMALGTRCVRPMDLRLRLNDLRRGVSVGCTAGRMLGCRSRKRRSSWMSSRKPTGRSQPSIMTAGMSSPRGPMTRCAHGSLSGHRHGAHRSPRRRPESYP